MNKGVGECANRIRNLESIGFIWNMKEAKWSQMFEELKQHKAQHGHADVCQRDADNSKLGRWVTSQRSGYKNYNAGKEQKSMRMTEERIHKLESISFK